MNKQKINHQIYNYPAVFEPAKEGGFNVSFPNFPGCVTFSKTFEDAMAKAKEVLELWLEELTVQKEEIPFKVRRPIIADVEVSVRAR